jgi:3-oxoacyl-[acyl-carrier-protein] synthase-3
MRYSHVCVEAVGYTIPEEIWTSATIEDQLTPLYDRLKLPAGRLELMTGIAERRFWPRRTSVRELSICSGVHCLTAADFDPSWIGCLIHGSVCRDFLEPATACSVHHELGLPKDCLIYDVSNACLGILSGMVQAANMIELGQIKAALIVGSEGGRQLVEHTIDTLNRDHSLTRQSVKHAIASLTIGSASCAVLLTHQSISRSQTPLRTVAYRANTQFHDLCQSHEDQAGSHMRPLMKTDSEKLMQRGIESGIETMRTFLQAANLKIDDFDRTICHQVGSAHRNLMLESLNINPAIDFTTFQWLGNTGSAAAPITMALAAEQSFVQAGHRVAILGIGSGINCLMMEINWNKTLVAGSTFPANTSIPTQL